MTIINLEKASDDTKNACICFIYWCSKNSVALSDSINGIPVLCRDGKLRRFTNEEELKLIPLSCFDEDTRSLIEIIPKSCFLDERYHDVKDYVIKSKIATNELLYEKQEDLSHPDSQHLIKDKGKEQHNIKEIDLKYVRGLREILSQNELKNRQEFTIFLNFLFKYIVKIDNSWNEFKEVKCQTQAHMKNNEVVKVFPCGWLKLLKKEEWVLIFKKEKDVEDIEKKEKPNSENLKEFLTRELTSDSQVRDFLSTHFNFDRFLLLINSISDNEQDKNLLEENAINYTSIAQENPKIVDIINQIREKPNREQSEIIEQLNKKIKQLSVIHKNQEMGEKAEQILKNILKKNGFDVRDVNIGWDLTVLCDDVGTDNLEDKGTKPVKFDKAYRFLIEIKATKSNHVNMTRTQVMQSVKPEFIDKYILCILDFTDNPNLINKFLYNSIKPEELYSYFKIVPNIGKLIQDECNMEKIILLKETEIDSKRIKVVFDESSIKFMIAKEVWEKNGLSIEKWLESIKFQ